MASSASGGAGSSSSGPATSIQPSARRLASQRRIMRFSQSIPDFIASAVGVSLSLMTASSWSAAVTMSVTLVMSEPQKRRGAEAPLQVPLTMSCRSAGADGDHAGVVPQLPSHCGIGSGQVGNEDRLHETGAVGLDRAGVEGLVRTLGNVRVGDGHGAVLLSVAGA